MIENDNKPGESFPAETFDGASSTPSTPAGAYNGKPDDLHDLFGSGPGLADEEDPLAALRNDPNYAALIRDLEYIASQARMLFEPTAEAPRDEVWDNIKRHLDEEPGKSDS